MSLEDTLIEQVRAELVADGYSAPVAEALANRGVTVADTQHMSKRELLEHYLEWNGIIGYADSILSVIEDAEANCNF